MIFYAGIGPRFYVPEPVLKRMTMLASVFEAAGFVLRSGGAVGSDKAFEAGVSEKGPKMILRPKDATAAAIDLARQHHNKWEACDDYSRKLMGRNAQIILGPFLNEPAQFVVTWTPNAAYKDSGGTVIGVRIATAHGIPVINLGAARLQGG